MDQDSRPRARTVFETIEARHGGQPDTEPAQTPVVEKPITHRGQLVKLAANRELDRFAALTGVLATHLMTGAIMSPVVMLSIKAIVSAALFGAGSLAHFTWIQATALTGCLWLAGPLCFFLYRYWSGKY